MSYDGAIDLVFADDEHRFRLRIGELRELQEKCKAGPPVILQRLASQSWMLEDVAETIRLGLVGGGMAPSEALKRVQTYVHAGGWFENVLVAHRALSAAIVGPEDEDLGEKAGEGAAANLSPSDASASPASTETPAPSASASSTSTGSASGSSAPTSMDGSAPTAAKSPSRRRPTKSTTT